MLIKIELKISLLVKIFVRIRQELTILLNLLNFLEVFSKYFRCILSSNPARCLLNNFLNDVILDDFANVNLIVCLLEDAVLTCVFYLYIVEKLQPKIF